MILNLLSTIILTLSITPQQAWAPATLLATIRVDRAVLGEVCLEMTSVRDTSSLIYRSSCEGIDGRVKQIRWRSIPTGEYHLRATFRGGQERAITAPLPLIVRATLGER